MLKNEIRFKAHQEDVPNEASTLVDMALDPVTWFSPCNVVGKADCHTKGGFTNGRTSTVEREQVGSQSENGHVPSISDVATNS